MSPLLKNLIIALGITILLGIVYAFTIGNSDTEFSTDDMEITTQTDDGVSITTEQILSDTQELNTYLSETDTAIFKDKRFTSLKDFRVEIEDVPTGRENPFDPIE